MKFFKLPDLGEGLPEADIVEWHVKEGESVTLDQPLVSVETAKAIIEIPSPQAGIIAHLFGAAGDTVHTGEPLVEFISDEDSDSGTVVGSLKRADTVDNNDHFIIGASPSSLAHRNRITPAIRSVAQRLNVDLNTLKGTGAHGVITLTDVELAAKNNQQYGSPEQLQGVRKHMANAMTQSHAQVVPVSLFEDANISHWPDNTDITLCLIKAIARACQAEPILNSWYEGEHRSLRKHQHIDLGIAVDTEHGLFVPVMRNITERSDNELRSGLDHLRKDVIARKIPPAELQGATITLSNFGTMSGRYATPIIIPPQVAIIATGAVRSEAIVDNDQITIGRILPVSLTFDHRVATGGEASRFLQAFIQALQENEISVKLDT